MGQQGSLRDEGIVMGQRDPIYGTKASLRDKGNLMGQTDPRSYLWDKRDPYGTNVILKGQRDPIYGTKGILFMGQRDPYGKKGAFSWDTGIYLWDPGPRAPFFS